MTEMAPDTLVDSRYKVLTRIGSGGMADVFCAEDQQLGRKVALKLLHRRFAGDAEFVERFRREASSAAGLSHPNVVAVYDRGQWDGTYYIAMEYLPGRTLKDVIRQESPIDPLRAIDLTTQILKAARFAHRRGIVHRDLKPQNVLIDDEDRAKVTDFGIARAGASEMTETGSIMGTAQYLSPEQAQGLAVSPSADLYSIGVILFELLTGQVPFDAETAVSIALKHVAQAPPTPSALNPEVPPELDAVVLWALNKDPQQRPADADAFLAALDDAREAITARRTPGQRTAVFAPLAAVGAGEVPYGPATSETAVVGNGGPPAGDEGEPPGTEPRRRRGPAWWVWALVVVALAGVGVAAWALTRPVNLARVPAVVGKDQQTAQAAVEGAGLRPVVVQRQDDSRAGTVLVQSPVAGKRVKNGSTVTLTVATGPTQANVPAVGKLSEEVARATIINAGLQVGGTTQSYSSTVPAGDAIGTKPPAGTTVDAGSNVTLVLSRGPAPVQVPKVVGFTESDARTALSSAGFNITSTTQTTKSTPDGQVISQSPGAGTTAAPGTTVSLVVAKAPKQVALPDVGGASQADAEAQLKAAGFEVRVSQRNVGDPAQDGVVVGEQPAPGTRLDAGAPVRIFVGKLATSPAPPSGQTNTTPTTPAPPGGQ